MTQEEKLLLLKDLSARLPYGVIVNYKEGEYDFHKWKIETLYAPEYSESGLLIETNCDGWIGYTDYKGCGMSCASRPLHLGKNLPYLRSMSSMTEEEKKELRQEHIKDEKLYAECLTKVANGDDSMRGKVIPHFAADWCNKNHFDFRGLIPMGLALEAPGDMYKTK